MSAKAPKWAQELTIQVALDEYRSELPDLVWRRSRAFRSSGHTQYERNRVVVTAGKDRRDQKLVLLHELAHWLIGTGERGSLTEHHSPRFWDKAWELYRRYKVPILYAKTREGIYRKGALVAYRRSR